MIPRWGRPTAILLLCLLLWPAAGYAETLRAVYSNPPASLDPHGEVQPAALPFIYPCYERLTAYKDRSTEVEPSLALTWRTSDDGRLYTFVLDQGHTFSDGQPVDARAVQFSFQRAMAMKGSALEYFPELDGIEIIGPYTVRFVLKASSPSFPEALATAPASIVSPGVVDQAPGYLDQNTLGSGPYQVQSWLAGRQVVLEARSGFEGKFEVNRIEVRFDPDPDVQKELLCLEEVHLADRIPDAAVTAFEFETRVTTTLVPSFEIRVLALNMERTWLANAEAKRGLATAIDMDGLLNQTRGETERLSGPLPTGVLGAPAGIAPGEYSSYASRQLLEEAGLPERPLVLTFNPRKPGMAVEAGYIKHTLAGFGLETTLVEYQGEAPVGVDYDLALVDFQPRTGAAEEFLRFYTGPDNPARYRPEATNRVDTAAGDRNGLKSYYREAFQSLVDDGPYIFLYRKTLRFGVSRGLTSYAPHPLHPHVIPTTGLELREPPIARDEPEMPPMEQPVRTLIEDSPEAAIPQDAPPDFKD